ncbi:beta-lactamase family protein [Hypoxylon sp. FL1284]|nr:beta-lactamase family protein [Hypoxylon sp. FL1284]
MDIIKSEAFSSRVRELMDKNHIPGMAVAVVKNDKTASTAFGHASLDPPVPFTTDTLFDIASCSKSMTAAAVGLLVEDDERYPEVQYEATMSSLLPDDFVMPSAEHTNGVTVDDILSHRSGMARHDDSYLGSGAARPDDARSVTRNLRNLPVAASPRARYMYCNMMYTAATHLVEAKTGQPFADFLEARIFGPLGMRSTSLQPSRARARGHGARLSQFFIWDARAGVSRAFDGRECGEGQGAGSVMTSADDFVLWVRALLRREGPITGRVYQGLVRQRMLTSPTGRGRRRFASPSVYAAGLEVHYYRGHMVVEHGGMFLGYCSHFFFLPDSKFGACIIANSDSANGTITTIARELIDAVLGVPKVERPPRNNAKKKKDVGALHDVALRPKKEPEDRSEKKTSENDGGKKKGKHPDNSKDESKDPAAKDTKPAPKTKKSKKAKSKAQAEEKPPPPPQEIPLESYVGRYWHPGYHTMAVEIRDGRLFVDCADRSVPFSLTFEHVGDQTRYTAYIRDAYDSFDEPDGLRAEFVLDGGRAVRLGLHMEASLKELIWFELQRDA